MTVLAIGVVALLGLYTMIYKTSSTPQAVAPIPTENNATHNAPQRQLQAQAEDNDDSDDEEGPEQAHEGGRIAQPKMMGKKKRLKMERKAALQEYRRYQLEQSKERNAEEKKRLKEVRSKEKAEEKEAMLEDEAWAEYLKKKEQEEQKEYDNWRSSMSVESSGTELSQKDKLDSKADEVVQVILRERVVILESLSSRFETTTSLMVELIQRLVAEGKLEGILDERGKFIQIGREDRLKIAKTIQRRGRVSIGDLSREVNNMISLDPIGE